MVGHRGEVGWERLDGRDDEDSVLERSPVGSARRRPHRRGIRIDADEQAGWIGARGAEHGAPVARAEVDGHAPWGAGTRSELGEAEVDDRAAAYHTHALILDAKGGPEGAASSCGRRWA